jgi:small subunit ribosomal protein S6
LKRYEGMFLFDNTTLHEWSEVEAEVRRLFERIAVEPLVCLKFDERKLAYEIKGRKRGTYVLTYFDADPQRIADLERDARLSELILRTMVIRADKLSEERLAQLKAHTPDQPLQPISSDGRSREGGPRTRSEAPDEPEQEARAAEEAKPKTATAVEPKSAPEDKTEAIPEPAPELDAEVSPLEEASEDRPADD